MSDDRSKQVYIGYLPNDARMDDVEDFFKGFGKIKSINLKPGYGFVDFEDERDVEDAVKHLDGKRMCGETVDIQRAKGPGHKARDRGSSGRPIVRDTRRSRDRSPRRRSYRSRSPKRSSYRHPTRSRSRSPPRRYSPPKAKGHKLLLTNVSTRCRSKNVKDAIRDETKIDCNFCEIHTPRDREGTVSFDSKDDMEEVYKKMNGFELKGRKLEFTKEKSESRSKSKSRERSRSSEKSEAEEKKDNDEENEVEKMEEKEETNKDEVKEVEETEEKNEDKSPENEDASEEPSTDIKAETDEKAVESDDKEKSDENMEN